MKKVLNDNTNVFWKYEIYENDDNDQKFKTIFEKKADVR